MNKISNIKTTLTLLFLVWVTVGLSQCTSPQSNCNNFDIPITNNTSAINYGIPEYNGQVLTDFIINWVDEDGNVAFTSAGGSFYDPNLHESHPPVTDIPLGSGFYEPVLVDSNIDGVISCKSSVEIVPYECTGDTQVVTYEGTAGGITRLFEINIPDSPADCNIKVDFFDDELVDTYNIYTVDNMGTLTLYVANMGEGTFTYPMPSGFESLLVEVTSDAGNNTIWSFTFECCYVPPVVLCDDCDAYDPRIVLLDDQSTHCDDTRHCYVEYLYESGLPPNCNFIESGTGLTFRENCSLNLSGSSSADCINTEDSVQIDVTTGQVQMVFQSTTDYAFVESLIVEMQGITNAQLGIRFFEFFCGDDGDDVTLYFMNYNNYTFDATNNTITVEYDALNQGDSGFCPVNGVCTPGNLFNGGFNDAVANGGINVSLNTQSILFYNIQQAIIQTTFQAGQNTGANVQNDNFSSISYFPTNAACGDDFINVVTPVNVQIQDLSCPCESWRILADDDNDGNYDVLLGEAPNWTGTCQ